MSRHDLDFVKAKQIQSLSMTLLRALWVQGLRVVFTLSLSSMRVSRPGAPHSTSAGLSLKDSQREMRHSHRD